MGSSASRTMSDFPYGEVEPLLGISNRWNLILGIGYQKVGEARKTKKKGTCEVIQRLTAIGSHSYFCG